MSNINEDDGFLGIPIRQPTEIVREQFAGVHRKDVIPASVQDMMAAILFDPRDEISEHSELGRMHGRDALHELTPMQRKARGAGNDPETQEILARGAEFHEAMKAPVQSFNMGPDVYQLMKDAAGRCGGTKGKAFYMSDRTYRAVLDIRVRHKRKKRRARYNRGKMGVRPRKRAGGR